MDRPLLWGSDVRFGWGRVVWRWIVCKLSHRPGWVYLLPEEYPRHYGIACGRCGNTYPLGKVYPKKEVFLATERIRQRIKERGVGDIYVDCFTSMNQEIPVNSYRGSREQTLETVNNILINAKSGIEKIVISKHTLGMNPVKDIL